VVHERSLEPPCSRETPLARKQLAVGARPRPRALGQVLQKHLWALSGPSRAPRFSALAQLFQLAGNCRVGVTTAARTAAAKADSLPPQQHNGSCPRRPRSRRLWVLPGQIGRAACAPRVADCRENNRGSDGSEVRNSMARAPAWGAEGIECSSPFAPTKINHLGAGRKSTASNCAGIFGTPIR